MGTVKSTEQKIQEIWKAPGIIVPSLAPGTKLIIETTAVVFELQVIDHEHVQVNGTDPRFHKPVVGRFIQSVYDAEATMKFPGWIGKNLRMEIEFANATFSSTPVISAGVIGKGYHYDVF